VVSVRINSDKSISIGSSTKHIFPVGIDSMTHPVYDNSPYEAAPGPYANRDTVFSYTEYGLEWSPGTYTTARLEGYRKAYEAAGTMYTLPAFFDTSVLVSSLIDSPQFFSYCQIDEPENQAIAYRPTLSQLLGWYNDIKARDSNHPVFLNCERYPSTYLYVCDILAIDRYPIRPTTSYTRSQAIYAQELYLKKQGFDSGSASSGPYAWDNHNTSQPVWFMMQANGLESKKSSTGDVELWVPTKQEARALMFSALCVDFNGIVFWCYQNSGGMQESKSPPECYHQTGTRCNSVMHAYYMQLAREVRDILNDALVSPTIAHSWYGLTDLTSVNISPNPLVYAAGFAINKFSYLLKRNTINGKYYLFVVNKDANSTTVSIDITALHGTGSLKAVTIGYETSGSAMAGVEHYVSNGVFSDTFDGFGSHAYELSSTSITPAPTPTPTPGVIKFPVNVESYPPDANVVIQ